MTKEELREHCEKQVKMCEEWAKGNDREPSGKIYEEHKLILDLIKALEQEAYYKNLAQSYEKTINKLTKAIAEQQPSEDCVSRQAVIEIIKKSDACLYEKSDNNGLVGKIKTLSPVTPTHGTCKECANYVMGALDEEICLRGHELIHKDFYCADYEKAR